MPIIIDGREVLATKPYSTNPGDKHLSIVLCNWQGKYVTWNHNSEDHGFYLGHYFDTMEEGLTDFNKRPY